VLFGIKPREFARNSKPFKKEHQQQLEHFEAAIKESVRFDSNQHKPLIEAID